MDVSVSLVHSLDHTILHIALKGIHTIMFGEEIARIRKLGVQGVSSIMPFGG